MPGVGSTGDGVGSGPPVGSVTQVLTGESGSVEGGSAGQSDREPPSPLSLQSGWSMVHVMPGEPGEVDPPPELATVGDVVSRTGGAAEAIEATINAASATVIAIVARREVRMLLSFRSARWGRPSNAQTQGVRDRFP